MINTKNSFFIFMSKITSVIIFQQKFSTEVIFNRYIIKIENTRKFENTKISVKKNLTE